MRPQLETRSRQVLAALDDRDIFIVGGDSEQPRGEFPSANALLAAIRNSKHQFDEIGIAAYPEGHPFLNDAQLLEALHEKQPFASYMSNGGRNCWHGSKPCRLEGRIDLPGM